MIYTLDNLPPTSVVAPWALMAWGGQEEGKRIRTRLAYLVTYSPSRNGWMGYVFNKRGLLTARARFFPVAARFHHWISYPSPEALRQAKLHVPGVPEAPYEPF